MAVIETCKTCWSWLRDETNRKIIGWIGSGLVVAASGLWISYEKRDEKSGPPVATSTMTVHGDGVVAGRDVNQGVIVGKPTGEKNPDAQTPYSSNIEVQGDGVVGGRDVNTSTVVFGD